MFSCLCLKVLDTNPLPGMMITPSEGVVPVGGHADLRICFTPIAKMSFDTRVEVFKTGRICLLSLMLCVYLWRCMYIWAFFWFFSPVCYSFLRKKMFITAVDGCYNIFCYFGLSPPLKYQNSLAVWADSYYTIGKLLTWMCDCLQKIMWTYLQFLRPTEEQHLNTAMSLISWLLFVVFSETDLLVDLMW